MPQALLVSAFVVVIDEGDWMLRTWCGPKQFFYDQGSHDGFAGTWGARTYEGATRGFSPLLINRFKQEPVTRANMMSLDSIAVLLQVIYVADLVQKFFLPLGRKLIQDQGCVVLDDDVADL
jgi:hypothetical protein